MSPQPAHSGERPPPPAAGRHVQGDRHGGLRDLLITTETPALRSGKALRTYGVARALSAHRDLDLLYVRFGASEPDAAFRSMGHLTMHEIAPSRGARRLHAYARARLAGVPDGIARGVSSELIRAASRLAAEPDRGRIVADGPTAAAALIRLAHARPLIYNAHNLESAFRHELGRSNAAESERLQAFEQQVLRRFDECWMVSMADLMGARALCPQATLRYVPNVVDVAAIMPVAKPASQHRAIFVGSFHYQPNRAALRFLLDEVMPRVWRELPDARLTVVGAGLTQPPSSDARVEAPGFVDDLLPLYQSAACALVPLLQSGGTPLKLIEALAHGLPVIATSKAAAALELRDGEDCLIADGGDRFSASLLAVLRDGAPLLARRGRELAERRYSIEALTGLLAP